tara:strand:+ start:1281 stop:2225 length:945 start_codon:yes stop_codon:yes gene_type:complete
MFEIISHIIKDILNSIKKIVLIYLLSSGLFVIYLYTIDERFTSYSKLLPSGASASAGKSYNSLVQSLTGSFSSDDPILFPFVYTEILNSYDFIDTIMNEKVPYNGKNFSIYEILSEKYGKDLSSKEDKKDLHENFSENLYNPTFSTLTNMIELNIEFYSPESAQIINQKTIDALIKTQNEYIRMKTQQEILYLEKQIKNLTDSIDSLDRDLITFLNENKDLTSPLLAVQYEKKKREIGIENSILSSTKLNYEDKKLKQLEEMNTLYIIEKPSLAVEKSFPRKTSSLIVFSLAFVIMILIRYYIRNYNYIHQKFV